MNEEVNPDLVVNLGDDIEDASREDDLLRYGECQAILREATEQCGRGVVPELLPALELSRALERATLESRVVMAYEGERRGTLKSALQDAPGTVSLFVGPEGGYAPAEAASAREAGARLITLGPRVLRFIQTVVGNAQAAIDGQVSFFLECLPKEKTHSVVL